MSRVSGITRTLSCNHRISISHAHIRRLSTQKDATTGRTRISSLYTLGVAGGVGIISAYFLWPDASRSAPTYKDATLSPSYFTPAQVLASEPCSHPDYRLITLGIPKQLVPSLEQTALSPIWSIFIKDDDIQVERPYTPLTGIDEEGRMKFWIKKYPKGEVGRWIHSKHVGDSVEIRGPLKTWPWKDGIWDEVVMVNNILVASLRRLTYLFPGFGWYRDNAVRPIITRNALVLIGETDKDTIYSIAFLPLSYGASITRHPPSIAYTCSGPSRRAQGHIIREFQ